MMDNAVPTAANPVYANPMPANPSRMAAETAKSSVFLPLLLISVAFVAWTAFQSAQLVMEQQQLAKARSGLEPQEAGATKLRASLDAVASATARLAETGNPNARVIVDELRKRGVTINPAAAAAVPPK